VCKFCGKSSRLKGNLTKHILKHHKREQTEYTGHDDIIIKKGKKSVKDPVAIDFIEKSMVVLGVDGVPIDAKVAPLPTPNNNSYLASMVRRPTAQQTTESDSLSDNHSISMEELMNNGRAFCVPPTYEH
jgi:hypothetical protein